MTARPWILILAAILLPSIAQAQSDPTPRELLSIMNEREHANAQRFDAQEKAVAAALAAAKEAVIKAEAAAEKRFDSVNEFRNTLKDQQQLLVTRNEVDIRLKGIEEKIAAVQERQTRAGGWTEGIEWLWGAFGAAGGLLIGGATFAAARWPRKATGRA